MADPRDPTRVRAQKELDDEALVRMFAKARNRGDRERAIEIWAQIVHDHADHRALPGGDGPGLQVRGVAELGDGLVDALGQPRPDPARALVHHPGRGGQRDPGPVGDVLQRHPADLVHGHLLAGTACLTGSLDRSPGSTLVWESTFPRCQTVAPRRKVEP